MDGVKVDKDDRDCVLSGWALIVNAQQTKLPFLYFLNGSRLPAVFHLNAPAIIVDG